jgi:hypothetical protein
MSERERYEAGKEARRTVLHGAGGEEASSAHIDALLHYLKGAGEGHSAHPGPQETLTDHEIRRRIVDRVLDAGGEVSAAIVAAGSVWLRGRVGCRSEIALLERTLRNVPGVTRLDMCLGYDIDDTADASAPDRSPVTPA